MQKKLIIPIKKKVKMDVPEGLYNKVNELRERFNQVNGMNISLLQAGEIFSRGVKFPKIPNIIEDSKRRKNVK